MSAQGCSEIGEHCQEWENGKWPGRVLQISRDACGVSTSRSLAAQSGPIGYCCQNRFHYECQHWHWRLQTSMGERSSCCLVAHTGIDAPLARRGREAGLSLRHSGRARPCPCARARLAQPARCGRAASTTSTSGMPPVRSRNP